MRLGNQATTATQSVTIDRTAPAAGLLAFANLIDSGSSNSDGLTNDNAFDLTLSGNEAGSNVVYQVSTNNGTSWTTTTAAPGGAEIAARAARS